MLNYWYWQSNCCVHWASLFAKIDISYTVRLICVALSLSLRVCRFSMIIICSLVQWTCTPNRGHLWDLRRKSPSTPEVREDANGHCWERGRERGRRVQLRTRQVRYSHLNLPRSIANGGQAKSFGHLGGGRRVEQILLVCVHEQRRAIQLLLAQQLCQLHWRFLEALHTTMPHDTWNTWQTTNSGPSII